MTRIIVTGPRSAFVVDAVTFLVSAAFIVQLPSIAPAAQTKEETEEQAPRFWREFREGLSYLIHRRSLLMAVASNSAACTAAAREARRLGYRPAVITTRLEGDNREAARFHMSLAQEVAAENRPVRRPACILSGGETTVKIAGTGKGGRNMEFALACARALAALDAPCLVASVGTDGTDGPTDAAGAVADNTTAARSLKFGAGFLTESLENNDSYGFFRRMGDLIVTGPTGTNVMDLHLILIGQ